MKIFSLSEPEISRALNDGVDHLLSVLLKEKVMTKEQVEKARQYRLTVGNKTLWGSFCNFFKFVDSAKDNDGFFFVVKLMATDPKLTNLKKETNEDA